MSVIKAKEVEVAHDPMESARGFWEKNQKVIIGISAVIIILIGGWLAYKKFFKEPAEEKAAAAMFKAEEYFKNDSLNLALNGDGASKGFLYIIKNYGGTKSANLAQFYAGNVFLRNNDYNNAIKYLKEFNTDAKQVQMIAYGRLGDAYSELKKNDEAIDNYKKAGNAFPEDENNSAEFLFRAGYLSESLGKNSDALEFYKQIKEKYPTTEKGYTIDKFIYRLSVEKNEFSVK